MESSSSGAMTACMVSCCCIFLLPLRTTLETCGSISGYASFSSSLDCLVYRFRLVSCFSLGFEDVYIIPQQNIVVTTSEDHSSSSGCTLRRIIPQIEADYRNEDEKAVCLMRAISSASIFVNPKHFLFGRYIILKSPNIFKGALGFGLAGKWQGRLNEPPAPLIQRAASTLPKLSLF